MKSVTLEEKRLPANLDFYSALILTSLSVSVRLFPSIFVMGKTFGNAHYEEQYRGGKVIRPEAVYTERRALRCVPLAAKK